MTMEHPYAELTPDRILDALEAQGYRTSGHFLALNSYENRVYQVGLEEGAPIIAKFYRPGRWDSDAILEEHEFSFELEAAEIPLVAPLRNDHGESLFEHEGFRFALFPRRNGHWPELDNLDTLEWLGRIIGRLHAIGASHPFEHRPSLDRHSFGVASYEYLMASGFVPKELELSYRSLAEDLLDRVAIRYTEAGEFKLIRSHGDCHPGNILWRDEHYWLVDLDDCRMAPAIQDLWMLISGERNEMGIQLSTLIEGYEQFMDFNRRELHLLESLRTLRLMHYAAWLARRWDDPAFQQAFPWFNSVRYWEEHILTLREQLAQLDEPCLQI